jgi:hypothetical protein
VPFIQHHVSLYIPTHPAFYFHNSQLGTPWILLISIPLLPSIEIIKPTSLFSFPGTANTMVAQKWDHEPDVAVLLAYQKHAAPTNDETMAIMNDLTQQDFTFTREGVGYDASSFMLIFPLSLDHHSP